MKNLGSASNKNMLFSPKRIILVLDQWDGHTTASQEDKVRFTALLEQILHTVELSLMPTIRLAYMLASKSQEQILKQCQVSLSSRSDLALALKSEIISGSLDTSLEESPKTSKFQFLMTLSCLSISLAPVVTSTFQQKL